MSRRRSAPYGITLLGALINASRIAEATEKLLRESSPPDRIEDLRSLGDPGVKAVSGRSLIGRIGAVVRGVRAPFPLLRAVCIVVAVVAFVDPHPISVH